MVQSSLKEIRNNIVDHLENFIRKFGLEDNHICNILRGLHFGISVITGLILLLGSKFWFLVIIAFNIFVYFLFFIFNGCILSKLEHRFTNDDFTVIDPFLKIINVELTNENRHKYSILSNIITLLITFFIYYIRFVRREHKKEE